MKSKGIRQKLKGKKLAILFLIVACCLLPVAFAQDHFWQTAQPDYRFNFPRDEASHPDYRIEQWSYSGHLAASNGRRFGYQLKFIRAGLNFKPDNPSRWAVRDLFVTQLAVTDLDGKQFKSAERINRAGVGWAGAATEGFRLWNDDWEAQQDRTTTLLRATQSDDGIGLELALEPGRSPVTHGEDGVFQKGFLALNASHFYSQPRMPTRGLLLFDSQRFEVIGTSQLDHEFGTSFLEEGQAGWDYFAIELEDGTDLMIDQLRQEDGSRDQYFIATLINADGSRESLKSDEFAIEPLARWTSPTSGGNYPVQWRVKIPGRQIELEAKATLDNQEFQAAQSIGVTYWKGLIGVSGKRNGQPINGKGFLEMTGYAGKAMGALSE
jgi:predicted secreted hydrolase